MPHVLWLHSSLTSAKLDRWGIKAEDHGPKRKLLGLHLRENVVILAIAGCVNVAILVVGAAAFFDHGYTNIQQISQAYEILEPLFGSARGGDLRDNPPRSPGSPRRSSGPWRGRKS